SLSVMTHLAQGARGRGDPFGPVTIRLVRGCLRDMEVYDRNRERIADISDPETRAEIYQCMTRVALSLDGVLSETESIKRIDETVAEQRGGARADDLAKQREECAWRRNASFDFILEAMKENGEPLAAKLRSIARASPQALHEILARNQSAATRVNAPPSEQAPAAD